MCDICRQTPCHPMCPNAEDPEPVLTCSVCGEGLHEGDEYYDGPEGAVCPSCLHDMDGVEVLQLIGESMKTVERETVTYGQEAGY